MLILIDNGIPEEAKNKLATYGRLIELEKTDVTYPAISSHPDIYYCQFPDNLIIAPNSSDKIINLFKSNNLKFDIGFHKIGAKYPESSSYNAVVTEKFLIHNTKYTEKLILDNCNSKIKITVNQSYTRCNLVPLGAHHFITSDMGIYQKLKLFPELSVIYVNPENIILPGMKNGFIGGCCGVHQDNLFVCGKLDYLKDAEKLRKFIRMAGFNLIELYNGYLYDGGSILFV
jgi:hypothetical protein